MERHNKVIKVKPDKLLEYKEFHANIWQNVAQTIRKCNKNINGGRFKE